MRTIVIAALLAASAPAGAQDWRETPLRNSFNQCVRLAQKGIEDCLLGSASIERDTLCLRSAKTHRDLCDARAKADSATVAADHKAVVATTPKGNIQ